MKAIACLFLLLFPLYHSAYAADLVPEPQKNISYGPHPRQIMDIWTVAAQAPTPIVIYVHGGGFAAGDKSALQRLTLTRHLHAAGIAIASMNYRFIEHAPLPDILREGARAVQFLRMQSQQWNIDPDRIAMVGTSAGAGISLWTAFHEDVADPGHPNPLRRQSSRIRCVAAINPQAGYDPITWIQVMGIPPEGVLPSFYKYLGGYPRKLDELLLNPDLPTLSLLNLMKPGAPPVFLMNTYRNRSPRTTGEYQHHPDHVRALAARCRQLGIEHTVSLRNDKTRSRQLADFLLQHLLPQP